MQACTFLFGSVDKEEESRALHTGAAAAQVSGLPPHRHGLTIYLYPTTPPPPSLASFADKKRLDRRRRYLGSRHPDAITPA